MDLESEILSFVESSTIPMAPVVALPIIQDPTPQVRNKALGAKSGQVLSA